MLRRWRKNRRKQKENLKKHIPNQFLEEHQGERISLHVEENIALLDKLLGENDDLVIRRFHVFGQYKAAIIYFSHLIDQQSMNTDILKPFMYVPSHLKEKKMKPNQLKDVLFNESLYYTESKMESQLAHIVEAIFRGETVVVIEKVDEAFLIDTRHVEKRAIDKPDTESVIRGPHEAFIEPLGSNLSLLRYRLQTPNFRVKSKQLGRLTKTKVAVCYIEGIVNPALVEEVQRRLAGIDTDSILDSGYIEQYIEEHHFSPFPQIQYTERPDKAVGSLLEGRVVLLVDGSPFALMAPAVFTQFYQTVEDYTERFFMGSLLRFIRFLALIFSLFASAVYVSVVSYNPELIPTAFAVAIAGASAGVPFPAVVEIFIMEVAMEILREAASRLPQQISGALSIVGVLIIGEAAVQAGFVNPITVVIVGITTIGSFATPAFNAAIAMRMLRFPMIILAGLFGLYGVMVGLVFVINHMLSLKSFGVPYISPIVPGNFEGMKDTLIRGPLWWMTKRPAQLHPPNSTRVSEQTVNAVKQTPRSTLDPLKVGNQRWADKDGISTTDHRHSSDDHHR